MLQPRSPDPIYAPGELVWIKPGLFSQDDRTCYIVMSNSIGIFGGWHAWLAPSTNWGAKQECFPETYLTRKNPYAVDPSSPEVLTKTGIKLLVIEGGFTQRAAHINL